MLPISKVFDLHLLTGDAYSLYAFEDEIDSSEDPGVLSFDLGSKDPTIAITDAALALFRSKLKMPAISKQDIFYYVYGVLSSPEFRDNFEMDVKKMGPRVPLLAKSFSISSWIIGMLQSPISLKLKFRTRAWIGLCCIKSIKCVTASW